MRMLLCSTLVLVACRAPAPAPPSHVEREAARLVLETHCAACHTSGFQTALPGALAVYDLLDEEWAAKMTSIQLQSLMDRMDSPTGPDGEPSTITDAEKAAVRRYARLRLDAMPARD